MQTSAGLKTRLEELARPITGEYTSRGNHAAAQGAPPGGGGGEIVGSGGLDDIDDGPLHGSDGGAAEPQVSAVDDKDGGNAVHRTAAAAGGGGGGEGTKVLRVWTDVPQVRDNLTRQEFSFGEWGGLAMHACATRVSLVHSISVVLMIYCTPNVLLSS